MARVYSSILVLVCVTVQSVVNGANICFDCTNLDAPDDCKQFHPCDAGQRCYKEVEETDNGTAAFNWGCASQLLCDLEAGTAARKKRISTERCFQCCDGNFCNFGPCTLDYCAAVTCQNGGSCNNEALKATCSCRVGFTGEFCEIEINECASSPCQNGATCLDLVGKYQCSCVAGYTGQNCELGIDECLSNPCLNGGTCIDAVNSYSCNCVPGFTGIFCETNINECESSPCRNSGTCTDMVNEYSCTCIPGITGKNCEINIDDCENVDCQNNGTCIDRINRFTCDCDYGFTGKLCETSLGRVCYNCTDADSVSECQSRTICGQNEECYIEHELTFAQKFRFTLGCVPSSLCSFLQGSGKRNAVALQLCYECCDENGCNHHACADTRGLGTSGK